MLQTFRDAWKVPEIRKKLLFTLAMIVIFRLGSQIPVPYMKTKELIEFFRSQQGGLLQFLDIMAGGNLGQFTIFALSIYPYITASIIIQLLTVAIPSLEALSKEGEAGRKKISKYTRYLAVVLAAIQATGSTFGFFKGFVAASNMFENIVIILSITAGTMFLVWLGELITEKGVGNGISLLIFAGIVARFPQDIYLSIRQASAGMVSWVWVIIFFILFVLIVVFVVLFNEGERRIHVQYAKRVVGRKMYGGQSTHIPIKVLMSGVMPIIFAQTVTSIPSMLVMFNPNSRMADFIVTWLTPRGGPGLIINSIVLLILIVFFAFFYTTIQFNPVEYSKQLQQNGGFIPGIRPGRPTSDYLAKTVNHLVLPGALALAILAIAPNFLSKAAGMSFNFGGTSIIIVVGVVLETSRQLEQLLLMRHYKGFLK
ncbi:MAG: preprotein translocase subunit SecY [Tissierellia bacterium]|nr:preprotein translocase subunit SecY [Tissierellia bacterium]